MSALLELADGLYALDVGEFTAARDAESRRLAKEDADLARAIKALRKPTTAAWVVNQLVRAEADQVAQLLAVGDALREAQRSMSAEELRELTRQRRQVTASVTQRARALARERGVRTTEAVAEQVEATLTAAMLDPECGRALRSGLLTAPLRSTGVGDADVAGAVAAPDALGFAARPRDPTTSGGDGSGSAGSQRSRPGLRVVPDPDAAAKARAAAAEVLADAEEAYGGARADLEQAQREVDALEARSLQHQAEVDELRRRLAALEADAESTDDDLTEAEEARDAAQESLAEAGAERDEARRRLESLGGDGDGDGDGKG